MKRHYLNYKNSKVKSQNFKIPDFKIPAAAIFFKKIAAASSITNYHSEHFIFCHSERYFYCHSEHFIFCHSERQRRIPRIAGMRSFASAQDDNEGECHSE